LKIADQLLGDLTPSNPKYFYVKRNVLKDGPFPEAAEIRGASSNVGDLEEADIVRRQSSSQTSSNFSATTTNGSPNYLSRGLFRPNPLRRGTP
jgi:hypothetical protein